ncbi:MAG: nuclear transport factor 2 family protein [Pseudonocardiaceae bacterium]
MTNVKHQLQDRLAEVVDEQDVAAVLFGIARAMDQQDWGLVEASYTADAVGDYQTGPVTGRAAIVEMARGFLTAFDATQHLLGNVEVAVAGDVATTRSTFIAQHVLNGADGGRRVVMGGNYDDTLTRTAEGWRVSARRIRGIWSDGDFNDLFGRSE